MIVHRPDYQVGKYKGYRVMLVSDNPIEEYSKFLVVAVEVRDKIEEVLK